MAPEDDNGPADHEHAAEAQVDLREDLDVRIDAMLDKVFIDARPTLEQYGENEKLRVLTILIGDQVGSTAIAGERINKEGKSLRDDFRNIYQKACNAHNGMHVEYAGDEFLAVFASPSDAVRCALALQAQYRDHSPFQVRMGLHDGEIVSVEGPDEAAQSVVITREVFGREVNICARICGMSSAERILLSRSVFDKARANIPSNPSDDSPGLTWENWGGYEFQGVERDGKPEAYEVCEVYETDRDPRVAPEASAKTKPVGDGEIPGWRPGPNAILNPGGWRMSRKLGEGGFGEVWLAKDKAGRQTVFKFCTKKSKMGSLRREYEVFNALVKDGKEPPGITRVLVANEKGQPPFYIQLPYAAGGDLREWIETHGKTAPLRTKLDIAAQLCRAVEQIHAANIVHRDIKPSNVLLEEEYAPGRAPEISICDFGIGQAVMEEAIREGDSTQEIAGGGGQYAVGSKSFHQAAGTYIYIAPELLLPGAGTPGKIAQDALPAADIYSLGVTLYQLFVGSTVHAPGIGLKGLDDSILVEDITDCLNTNPNERPTATELAQRIDRYDVRLREIYEKKLSEEIKKRTELEKSLYSFRMNEVSLAYAEGNHDVASRALWSAPVSASGWDWGYYANLLYPNNLYFQVSETYVICPRRKIVATVVSISDKVAMDAGATVVLWDLMNSTQIGRISLESAASAIDNARDVDRIAIGHYDGSITIWDFRTNEIDRYSLPEERAIHKIELSPKGEATIIYQSEQPPTLLTKANSNQWQCASLNAVEYGFQEYSAVFSRDNSGFLLLSRQSIQGYYESKDGTKHIIHHDPDSIVSTAITDDTVYAIKQQEKYSQSLVVFDSEDLALREVMLLHDEGPFDFDDTSDSNPGDLVGQHIDMMAIEPGFEIFSVSKDKNRIALVGGASSKVYIRYSDGMHFYWDVIEVADYVESASLSPDGSFLLVLTWNQEYSLWDIERKICKFVWKNAYRNHAPVFLESYALLRTSHLSSEELVLSFLALELKSQEEDFEASTTSLESPSWSPSRTEFKEFSLEDCRILAVDLCSGHLFVKHRIAGYFIVEPVRMVVFAKVDVGEDELLDCDFSSDGKRFLVLCKSSPICIFDSVTGSRIREIGDGDMDFALARFLFDGQRIVSVNRAGILQIWGVDSDVHLRESDILLRTFLTIVHVSMQEEMESMSDSLEIEVDREVFDIEGLIMDIGEKFIYVEFLMCGELYRLDINELKLEVLLLDCGSYWTSRAFCKDGSRFIFGSYDGVVKLFTNDGVETALVPQFHCCPVENVSLSSDGRYLVSSSSDITLLWDLETYSVVMTLARDSIDVKAWFSDDGRKLTLVEEPESSERSTECRVYEASPWRLEDLPEVDGDFATPEEERKARFFEWKRQEYQRWVAEHGGGE